MELNSPSPNTSAHAYLAMVHDKTIATGIWSKPHLSTSIVFDSDSEDGIYEIPSKPPGLGHAQTVTAICNADEPDQTTNVPSRLSLNSNDDNDGVDVVLSGQPGLEFISSGTRLAPTSTMAKSLRFQASLRNPALDCLL